MDLLQPTTDSLRFFYSRLIDGGVIMINDYGLTQFPGVKAAVEGVLADLSPSFFYPIPTGEAFLIK
ncbi:MAG: hypothetical protein IID32_12000 [Planctomycetes bacterium]|nr:hypothetical protein [Planctomycetota bacterium]